MFFEMRDGTNPERLPEVETEVFRNDVTDRVEVFLDEPVNTPDSDVISPRLVMSQDEARTLWLQLGKALGSDRPPRMFEARGTITVDYAMGFTEAEAREWFPNVRWGQEDASIAGEIEEAVASGHGPDEFWDCLRIKRDVVFDAEKSRLEETLAVGEL